MKRLSKIFPLLIIVFCAVALVILTQDPTQNVGESERSTYINVNVMGQDCGINVSYDNPEHEVYTLTSEVPVQVAVSEFSGIFVKINGVPFLSGEGKELLIERLAEDSYIHIECFDLQDNLIGEARIKTLPTKLANWSMHHENVTENQNEYYVAAGTCVYVVDELGNVLFYRDVGTDVYDFRVHKFDGKKYYSFFVNAENQEPDSMKSSDAENRVARMVLDEKGLFYDWIEYMLPSGRVLASQPIETNFLMLGDRHYLISAHVGKRVDNVPEEIPHSNAGSRVSAVILQEIKDGQLVFEWDSTEHPELYGYSTEDFYNREALWCNYAALTSIALDETDGNFLCFLRNCASVIKIDRTTGKILWCTKIEVPNEWDNLLCASVIDESLVSAWNIEGTVTFFEHKLSTAGTILDTKQYLGQTVPVCEIKSLQRVSDGRYIFAWEFDQQSVFTEFDAVSERVRFELFSEDPISSVRKGLG